MIHCPRVHKIYLFQTIDSLQKTRIVDFNWSKWRGKISWIIRRLRLTGEEFFILDKRWTLPRYDRAPECGATGVTGTAMTFMQIASVIVNTPRGNRFHSRFPFKEDSIASRRILSSPLPPLLPLRKWRASLRRSYAVARFRVEFRCKYGRIASRSRFVDRWFLFGSRSTKFHTILVTVGWKVARADFAPQLCLPTCIDCLPRCRILDSMENTIAFATWSCSFIFEGIFIAVS